jgi:hypothetical protein
VATLNALDDPLTFSIGSGASVIMGDKSPKAKQKQSAQKKAKIMPAAQKKERPVAALKTPPKRR